MPEKQIAYKVGNEIFATLEAAQRYELAVVMGGVKEDGIVEATISQAADLIMEHRERVKQILGVRVRKPRIAKAKKKAVTPETSQ